MAPPVRTTIPPDVVGVTGTATVPPLFPVEAAVADQGGELVDDDVGDVVCGRVRLLDLAEPGDDRVPSGAFDAAGVCNYCTEFAARSGARNVGLV